MRNGNLPEAVTDMLAIYGADLGRWPSPDLARSAREELLRDPDLRRLWDGERQLDSALSAERARMDDDLRRSGAADRLLQRTMAALPQRAVAAIGWRRIAAAVAVAVALGGTFDMMFLGRATVDAPAVLLVDNLVFGPDAVEL